LPYNYDEEEDVPIYEDEYDPPEYGNHDFDDHVTPEIEKVPTNQPNPPRVVPPAPGGPRVVPDPAHARPCDLKTDLYLLQPDRLNSSGQSNPLKVNVIAVEWFKGRNNVKLILQGKLTNCHSSGCERPFSVQKIPHSNLILLVVDTLCPCGSKQLDIEPQEIPGGAGELRDLEWNFSAVYNGFLFE
jgi:hypothetical protein